MTAWKVIKGIVASAIAATPGVVFIVIGQPLPLCILILVLGVAIGLAFALGNVSSRNVASLTVGTIIARNAPAPFRKSIIDYFDKDSNDNAPNPKAAEASTAADD